MIEFETFTLLRQVFPPYSAAKAQLTSYFSLGNGFTDMGLVIQANEVLGRSSDVQGAFARLTVVSVHSDALNCSDLSGRRWTLLMNYRDFQPRSVLMRVLPELDSGDSFCIGLSHVPVSFKSRMLQLPAARSWSVLISEWVDFLNDIELISLYYIVMVNEPIHVLSGIGPGFTPAGDDFITGWITAKLSNGDKNGQAEVRRFYEKWNQKGTTWFSGWMIKDAARKRIWRRGAVLVEALASGGSCEVTSAVSDILTWGHTSGRAWLAGFACGFLFSDAPREMIFCKN